MVEPDDEYRRLRDNIADGLKWIEGYVLPRIPAPLRATIEAQLLVLKELLDDRPPRFAIIGRRGSGKSSLINAILGSGEAAVGATSSTTREAKWYPYSNGRGEILILDTRGLGDGVATDKTTGSAEEGLKKEIERRCPDALLFLCKAKEVDARLNEDLESLARIRKYVNGSSDVTPPALGVVTQVDELDPPDISIPPYEDDAKQANIAAAAKLLRERMAARLGEPVTVIPVSAYMRFRDGVILVDRRWNVDTLVEELVERIPRSARLTLARIAQIKSAQIKFARRIVHAAVTLAGAVAAAPIPFADLPVITSIQTLMILGVASVGRGAADMSTVSEFLLATGLNVGVAFGFREAARALIKLIPVGGEFISAGIATAATKSLGEGAIRYFIKTGPKAA